MDKKEFDYYVFIDYSENLLGYMIIERSRIVEFIPKISKFAHYEELKHKLSYIHSIKKIIEKNKVLSYVFKTKIRRVTETPEIYSDILQFLKEHDNCLIFASIDNKQYNSFQNFVKIVDGKNIKIIKESELKIGTVEYQISLVLDNWLNIERLKDE